jgi:hypothetical protein
MTGSMVQFRAKPRAQMGSSADPDRQEVCCWEEDGLVSIATADGYVTKALMTPDGAITLAEWLRIRAIVARICRRYGDALAELHGEAARHDATGEPFHGGWWRKACHGRRSRAVGPKLSSKASRDRRRPGGDQLNAVDENARLKIVQRRNLELKNAALEGTLVSVADLTDAWGARWPGRAATLRRIPIVRC